jgi:hypothetical protein
MLQRYIHICALADTLFIYLSSFLEIQDICKSTISMRFQANLSGWQPISSCAMNHVGIHLLVALYAGTHTGCRKEKSSKHTAFVLARGPRSFFFLLANVWDLWCQTIDWAGSWVQNVKLPQNENIGGLGTHVSPLIIQVPLSTLESAVYLSPTPYRFPSPP